MKGVRGKSKSKGKNYYRIQGSKLAKANLSKIPYIGDRVGVLSKATVRKLGGSKKIKKAVATVIRAQRAMRKGKTRFWQAHLGRHGNKRGVRKAYLAHLLARGKTSSGPGWRARMKRLYGKIFRHLETRQSDLKPDAGHPGFLDIAKVFKERVYHTGKRYH